MGVLRPRGRAAWSLGEVARRVGVGFQQRMPLNEAAALGKPPSARSGHSCTALPAHLSAGLSPCGAEEGAQDEEHAEGLLVFGGLLLNTYVLQLCVTLADAPSAYAFLFFLGYLAFVTFVILRHALGVLEHKQDPSTQATSVNLWLARASIGASIALVVFALWLRPPNMIILLALSPIGIGTGSGILRYLTGKVASPKQWLYEHLGGMIGAGIAFHTAFAVVGFGRLFDYRPEGWLGVLPWVLPAAIGIPATVLLTRYYQRQFGEQPGGASPA